MNKKPIEVREYGLGFVFSGPDGAWKNEALSRQLYDAALERSIFDVFRGPPQRPRTRYERFKGALAEARYRIRRAVDVLRGVDEYW